MCAEVAWVLVSLGTKIQVQIRLDLDYLPDYPSICYCYGDNKNAKISVLLHFVKIVQKDIRKTIYNRLLKT